MRRLDFWSMVEIRDPDECWPWMGSRLRGGYGHFRKTTAHRIAYAAFEGPIPKGLVVMHTCDNPCYCNPAHLKAGTQKDNIADMHAKGRAGDCAVHGEHHGRSKLTWGIVDEIRSAYAAGGVSQQTLADKYGVNQSKISAVVLEQTWKPEHRPTAV